MTSPHTAASSSSHRHVLDHAPTASGEPTESAADDDGNLGEALPTLWRWISFVAGCALLVWCAWVLDQIPEWSNDYGRVVIFLGFFLVMSIGGRWFWAGIDAALHRIIGGRR